MKGIRSRRNISKQRKLEKASIIANQAEEASKERNISPPENQSTNCKLHESKQPKKVLTKLHDDLGIQCNLHRNTTSSQMAIKSREMITKRSLIENKILDGTKEKRAKAEVVTRVCKAGQNKSKNIKIWVKWCMSITHSGLCYYNQKKQKPFSDSNDVKNGTMHGDDPELPLLKTIFPVNQSDFEKHF